MTIEPGYEREFEQLRKTEQQAYRTLQEALVELEAARSRYDEAAKEWQRLRKKVDEYDD